MTPITIRLLVKKFGSTTAVDHINLDVPGGALFFLLGPSGCGKTTLLRMIAGFSEPTSGSIHFGERDVTHLQANERNTGMVFQSYALWPHMTVAQNVAFGLDVRKVAADEKQRRVEKALDSVQMLQYAQRKPNELSGGQQQRVALARALVIEPTVLLLDEPLSNLDAKLRLEMRTRIHDICKAARITAVYVTHDQKEALSMADGMAVLKGGKIIQTGAPEALYRAPANRFVADFLGETNFIPGSFTGTDRGLALVQTSAGTLRSSSFPSDLPVGQQVTLSIRPEAVRLIASSGAIAASDTNFVNTITATRASRVYLGETAQHLFDLPGSVQMKVFELNPRQITGDSSSATLAIDAADVVVLRD